MGDEKNKSGKLHYLRELKPELKKETEGVEELILELSGQLSELEKELHSNLNRIQRDLKESKSGEPKDLETLRKEFNELRSHFEEHVHGLSSSLQKKVKGKKSFLNSIINSFKKIIPDFGEDNSSKNFQELWNEDIDPYGRDPAFEAKIKPFFGFLFHKYWRTTIYGLENIPSKGRALLVSNHSGTLPYDGSVLRYAVSYNHPAERDVRFLVEDFVYYLPFIGTYMYRCGGVRASRENAERLLNSDHLVAVFPEGVKGIGKYYKDRYHLQRFGRGGFIKLALQTGSPIIPVAIIGAEEIHPILYKSSLLAKPLGIPYIPITPTLPLLGPLGLIPLPSKWSIYFGKPIDLSKKYGKKTLNDEIEIHKLSEMVRQTIQEMITEALKKRRSVWWG